jgi:hypothetical protein
MSQIMEQNPAYISYRYDTITISQVAGESFTFTVYSITDVGGNTFVPLTTLDTSDVVAAKTQEIYRLLVTAIFKGCCECGNTEPECSIQYVSGNGGDPGTILIGSGSARINYFTANNQDFTGFWPIIQDGSWFFIFSKTDPTVYGVFQLSNYFDGGTYAQFDVTLLAGTDIFPEGTELCIDVTSVGGSLVQDWQDTLIVGSTLTQDNTVDGGNFDFIFDNNNSFVINSPGGSIETDINGSSLIAGSQSITVNSSYIDIITPNYGSASTGWVLALDASGHVEYVEAGTGTISSIGLFMPPAFTVSTPNPLTSNGSFTVTGAGTVLEYIDGTGNLQTFPIYTVENGLHAFGGVPGEAPPDPYLFHLGGLLVEDTVITATNGGTEYVLGVAGTANQNTRRPLSVTNLGNGGVAVFSDFGSGSRPNPSVQMITDNDLFNPILTLSMQGDLPNPNPVFTDRTTLLRLRYDGTQAVGARMSIDYQFREDDPTPAYFIAGRLTTEMTDMTLGDEQSLFELQLYDQGSRQTKLQVTGPGQLILDEYGPAVFSDGTTNIDNSLSYVLATDNTGRVWKKLATGGGTVTSVGATGLLTTTATNPFTTSGVVTSQMNSGFLVGRYDAGLGVFQEIELGTNLSLVGNTLNATGGGPTYDSAEGVYKNTFLANDTFELGMDSPIGAFGTIPFLTDRYIDVDAYSFNISSQASNRFSFLASGQLQMLEYNNSTAFDAVSGPSVGVLNVDNTGRVFVADAGVGTTYTVDNGLIENPADNFQLGGPLVGTGLLVRDTYITNDGFPFVIDQIGNSTIGLNVRHTSSNPDSGTAIQATSSNGWAVRASINGNPATGDGNGSAYEGLSQNDYVAQFLRNDASSSGNVGLLKLTRNTTAIQPFGGIAGSIDFWIEARTTVLAPPPTQPTSSIVSEWTSPGPVGRNSSLYIYGYDDTFGGQVLNAGFNGIGLVSFYQYGQVPAQFYDPSPVWALGVDASGNVVEIDPGGSGPSYTVNNGLTENPANNFQLGGDLIQNTIVSGDTNQWQMTFDEMLRFTVNANNRITLNAEDNNPLSPNFGSYVRYQAGPQVLTVSSVNTVTATTHNFALEAGNISGISGPLTSFTVTDSKLNVRTPNVSGGTAIVGQVLTLQDLVTGEVEFQNAGGGGLNSGDATQVLPGEYETTITGVTSLAAGDTFMIKFDSVNQNGSTLKINTLPAYDIFKNTDVKIASGDIKAGQEITIVFDGAAFQAIGLVTNQLLAYVHNAEGAVITKGQAVYAFGASGDKMSVKLAMADADATSAKTIGLVYDSSIGIGGEGYIIIQGVIEGINTAAFTAGDTLYLSGSVPGGYVSTPTYAPVHRVYVGIVEKANAGNGQIYVRCQNGYELDEIHDVDLVTTPPVNNDVLVFDTSTTPDLWKAKSIPTILGYTPQDSSYPSYTVKANNTGVTATATDHTFRYPGNQTFTGTITYNQGGGNLTLGAGTYYYNWTRVGNMVNYMFYFYTSATPITWVANSGFITWDLPADMPNPVVPSGVSVNGYWLVRNFMSVITQRDTTAAQATFYGGLQVNVAATPTFRFYFNPAAAITNARFYDYSGTYFTS